MTAAFEPSTGNLLSIRNMRNRRRSPLIVPLAVGSSFVVINSFAIGRNVTLPQDRQTSAGNEDQEHVYQRFRQCRRWIELPPHHRKP